MGFPNQIRTIVLMLNRSLSKLKSIEKLKKITEIISILLNSLNREII